MTEPILLPGGRDVRASLDTAADDGTHADAVVVACPPHPQHRGHRGDERLVAVSDAVTARGVDCLRFDYGAWDEGYGESTDADTAVTWAAEQYNHVALFGFSFGGTIALVTATAHPGLAGVSALAPTARLNPDVDAVDAIPNLADAGIPTQVCYATRDTTADWTPVVEQSTDSGVETVAFDADHFFVGQAGDVAKTVAAFLIASLETDE